MKARADANMAIMPGDVTTREQSPQDELEELRARIEQARLIGPQPHERHCMDCFVKGRNAAIRLILSEP